MEIRHAIPDDAEDIAAITATAWKAAFRGVVNDSYLDNFDGSPSTRRENIVNAPPRSVQLVAAIEDEIVGWLVGLPATDHDCEPTTTYEIQACYVRPDQWRKGVGRQLIDHCLNGLDLARWNEVVVWTARTTTQSHKFYESIGFQRDGKESVIDRNGPVEIVRFRLSL